MREEATASSARRLMEYISFPMLAQVSAPRAFNGPLPRYRGKPSECRLVAQLGPSAISR